LTENIESDLSIYPIPFHDFVRVEWEIKGIINVQVSSLDGRVVAHQIINNKQSVNLQHLASGSYAIRLFAQDGEMRSILVLKD